jgi:hypothetical protein
MNKPDETVTIHFTGGKSLKIHFPPDDTADPNMASRIKRIMESRNLMVEVRGELLAIPFDNIEYIQVSPSPDKLPELAVRGGLFVE